MNQRGGGAKAEGKLTHATAPTKRLARAEIRQAESQTDDGEVYDEAARASAACSG